MPDHTTRARDPSARSNQSPAACRAIRKLTLDATMALASVSDAPTVTPNT